MKRRLTTTLLTATLLAAAFVLSQSAAFAVGRIIIIGDEWLLSNAAFTDANSQTTQLTTNIAGYFSDGGVGNFLAASNSGPGSHGERGVNGSALAAEMQSLGHAWTIDATPAITFANLSQYDGVFFSGTVGSGAANSTALAQYVQGGGSVLIMAGTGDFGSAAAEAGAWNPFLNQFGLGFGDTWFAIGVPELHLVPVIPGNHPLNQSLEFISWGYGQLALDLDGNEALNAVVVQGDFTGLENGPQGAINDVIAVYNVPVPEPTSAMLLLASAGALLILTPTCRRRSPRGAAAPSQAKGQS